MKKQPSPKISHLAAVAVTALICTSGESASAASRIEASEACAIKQIERYCTKSWRTAHMPVEEWNDSTQQVLVELLQKISRDRLVNAIGGPDSDERRELNRSIWRIAKRWVRRHRHTSLENIDVSASETSDTSETDEQIEAVLRIASQKLTPRQQEIVEHLRRGDSVSEIASKMQLPASRISNEKHRAIKQIRKSLCDAA